LCFAWRQENTFLKNCVETSKQIEQKHTKNISIKNATKNFKKNISFFAPNHHLTTTFVAFRCLMLWFRHLPIFIKNFFYCFISRTIFVWSLCYYERDDVATSASSSTTTSNGSISGCSWTGKFFNNNSISF
jgi:hypothetical protein